MITTIKKRDGRTAYFDINKIANAIEKSFQATVGAKDFATCLDLAQEVSENFEKDGITSPTVEQIQDMVEKILIDHGYVRTAKAYILYRAERTRVRNMNDRLMKTFQDITYKDANDSDIKRENANIDGNTAMGAMLKYGSEGAKHFYESYVLNPAHSEAHRNGDIHIHDLDFYTLTTTCCQIDLIKLFKGGFSTGHGVLREPNDIASYASLACIAIQSNQNDQHGGQSISNFDRGLAPGVAKTYKKRYCSNLASLLEVMDNPKMGQIAKEAFVKLEKSGFYPTLDPNPAFDKAEEELLLQEGVTPEIYKKAKDFSAKKATEETDKATYQAMEALLHNLNTMHSRAGAQTPFSSVNYGMDTSTEARMVMKNMLLVTEAGLGNGETAIFPIQIFRVKDGINFNPGEANYDLFKLACRVSAKRLFPNFSFQDAPYNLKYYKEGDPDTEISYMGCRTRVMGNVHDNDREITPGRGNLSFTSINLPRIAILSNKNIDWFFKELDSKIDLVVSQLLERFEIQAKKKVHNYPFLMGEGVWIDSDKLAPTEEVREVIKHGTLSMGFIGLAETLKALIGVHHGESEIAQNLGVDIISHMRSRMDEYSKKTGMNFTLLATPAEGLSGRFIRMDRARFGDIEGVTDKEYYTNSFHIPVYYPISAFKKIQLEAPYHNLTNAGHITYVELDGDPSTNLDAFEKIIRYMKTQNIGYGSINHPIDRDPICGYTGIIGDTCPSCGRKEDDGEVGFQRIRRITGYLVGTLDRFNNAKRAEVKDRVKHSVVADVKMDAKKG
ncbi:anaerobic ribonucleoside triphosphate reductase [Anaerotignum sp. MB30-C6]|uniref:anaerobic ribonucleoside triphosphate reductase n=1 Tax=Anaerotignum sp. MB30-C6 TaxID=3070814 RepID=UPI0027DD9AD2|nr:anaerobic ribonucleoside triphosphate reductase [Anaerotignum sp. MB30-C6]WMI80810.1 anaerobic ribonucleoside triphosphate reductase [Anaerotignum sp. MB30-C6]